MKCTKCSAFKLTVNGVCYECRMSQLLSPQLIKINLLNSRHECETPQHFEPKLIKINLLNSRHGCEASQIKSPKLIKINLLNSRHEQVEIDDVNYMGEIPTQDYLTTMS